MRTTTLRVTTGDGEKVFDLTPSIEKFLEGHWEDGLLNVFVQHATAGVVCIEVGAGSDDDLLHVLERLLPHEGPTSEGWVHRHGSSGHGRDHVVPALVGSSVTVPVIGGRMTLGTWQRVCLVDTNVDNQQRTVRLTFLSG